MRGDDYMYKFRHIEEDELNEYVQEAVKEYYTGCCKVTLADIIGQVECDYPDVSPLTKSKMVEDIVNALYKLNQKVR